MDKFILNALSQEIQKNGIVVRIDGEAAQLLTDLMSRSGINKKNIVSEMIKFCYPRTEIHRVTINIQDMEGISNALEKDV